ncbi:MAG TPA: hypothetical protein VEF04_00920, partial [Blastocatellia bacterium]|nr:hypothetical protein [Blastocatellia bacterium]
IALCELLSKGASFAIADFSRLSPIKRKDMAVKGSINATWINRNRSDQVSFRQTNQLLLTDLIKQIDDHLALVFLSRLSNSESSLLILKAMLSLGD